MKVAIIGYGFVGKALKNGIKDNVKIFLVDPKLNTAVNDLNSFLPDIVFICVPTPMKNNGYQDISILEQVIEDINKLSCSPQIVLKSTLLPNYLNNIEKLILTNYQRKK
jgi:UDP-glucose 6-dehydrogenase